MLKSSSVARRPSVAGSHVSSDHHSHHGRSNNNNINDSSASVAQNNLKSNSQRGGDDASTNSSPQKQQQQQPQPQPPPATVAMMEGVITVAPVSSVCPRIAALGTLRAVGQGHVIQIVETKGANNDSEVVAASRKPFDGVGHTKFILSVAFSPDGTLIASGSGDQLIILWDAKTNARRSALIGHNSGVRCVQFSHDGLFLASASSDHNCILWDCLRGNQRAQLKGHTMEVNTVAFAPDSSFLYSAGVDKTIFVWDLRAPVVQLLTKIAGHTGHIHAVAASPDGNYLLSTGSDRQIIVWDVRNDFKLVDSIAKHTRDVHCIAFNPDGSQFATGGSDGLIIVWNGNTFSEHVLLRGHTNRVMSVAFSATGTLLASASMDKSIGIWDPVKGGAMKGQLHEHGHQVYSVAFPRTGPNQNSLVSGSFGSAFIYWELIRGRVTATLEGAHTKSNIAKVEWVQLPEAAHRLLVKSTDFAGEVFLWDAESSRTTQLERVMEQEQKLREMDDMRIHQEKMIKIGKQRQENERKAELAKKHGGAAATMLPLPSGGGGGDENDPSNNNNIDGNNPLLGGGGGGGDEFGEMYTDASLAGNASGAFGDATGGGPASRIEYLINQLPEKIAQAVQNGGGTSGVAGTSPDSALRRKLMGHLSGKGNLGGGGDGGGGSTKDTHSHGDQISQHGGGGGGANATAHLLQTESTYGGAQQNNPLTGFSGLGGKKQSFAENSANNNNLGIGLMGRTRSNSTFGVNRGGAIDGSSSSAFPLDMVASTLQEVRETQRTMQKEVSDLHRDVNSLHAEMRSMQQNMAEILKLLKKK